MTDKEIINYEIITTTDTSDLVSKVCISIENGWQPFGGLIYIDGEESDYYAQAMVQHYEKENEE